MGSRDSCAARPSLRRDRAWHGSLPTALETGCGSCAPSNPPPARRSTTVPRLQLTTPCRLATKQEGLRIFSLTADLEGAKVLVPGALGSFRLRLPPELELVQVLGRDLPLAKTLEQMVPQSRWKVLPPYLRHQSPKVTRASSSLIRSCSAGSLDLVSSSASWRNRSRSASCAWRPDSTSSAMTRLALALFARASVLILRATPAERVTLCRRGLAELGIGRNQARCSCEPGLLNPPFKPCMRVSRTRLTDGLLMPHSLQSDSGSSRASDEGRAPARSAAEATPER